MPISIETLEKVSSVDDERREVTGVLQCLTLCFPTVAVPVRIGRWETIHFFLFLPTDQLCHNQSIIYETHFWRIGHNGILRTPEYAAILERQGLRELWSCIYFGSRLCPSTAGTQTASADSLNSRSGRNSLRRQESQLRAQRAPIVGSTIDWRPRRLTWLLFRWQGRVSTPHFAPNRSSRLLQARNASYDQAGQLELKRIVRYLTMASDQSRNNQSTSALPSGPLNCSTKVYQSDCEVMVSVSDPNQNRLTLTMNFRPYQE